MKWKEGMGRGEGGEDEHVWVFTGKIKK